MQLERMPTKSFIETKTINNHGTVKQGQLAYNIYSVHRRNRDVGDAIPYGITLRSYDD